MMKHLFAFLVASLFTAGPALAQSVPTVDRILAEEELTLGSAAYLAVVSANPALPEPNAADAWAIAAEYFRSPPENAPEDPATFGEFAFMLMQAHDVPGGVMYALLPGPRYAAREAVYRRWSSTGRAPGAEISGQEALEILNRFLIWKEESL